MGHYSQTRAHPGFGDGPGLVLGPSGSGWAHASRRVGLAPFATLPGRGLPAPSNPHGDLTAQVDLRNDSAYGGRIVKATIWAGIFYEYLLSLKLRTPP